MVESISIGTLSGSDLLNTDPASFALGGTPLSPVPDNSGSGGYSGSASPFPSGVATATGESTVSQTSNQSPALVSGSIATPELWDALMANAPDLATQLKYGNIFELNHVSPVMQGAKPLGSSGSASTSITAGKLDPAPVFEWTIPLGYGGTPPTTPQLLNRFGIKVFDDTNTLVFDSGVLTEGTTDGTIQNTGNTVVFIPRLSDWRTNVTNAVGTTAKTFRWVAYGGFFGDETLQSNVLTGDYWSSKGEITVMP